MSQLVQGALYPAVRPKDVDGHTIPLAPLPEQHRIIAEVETQFARLESGVVALKRVQANLKRYRAAVLRAACEGRLVPTEAGLACAEGRDYEPADRLLARIPAEATSAEVSSTPTRRGGRRTRGGEPILLGTGDVPDLPEGWGWTDLDTLTVRGPQNGLYLPQTAYGSGTPILRIDDFQNGMSRSSGQLRTVKASPAEVELYCLRRGDLIINRVNSPSHLGKCMVVSDRNLPALFESNMMRLRTSELIDARYVETYLRTATGRASLIANAKWAVNQASINQGDVASTLIPLPPAAEQRRIVAEVERRLSTVDEIEAVVAANLKRAERLRQAILKRAFEGKLVPQDPSDEPASVLLERIQAERAAVNGRASRAGVRRSRTSEDEYQPELNLE
jgi:type I restriction enzyme S subunit